MTVGYDFIFFSPISAQVMYTPNTQITYAFSSVTTLNICQYMFENNNKQNICTFSFYSWLLTILKVHKRYP